MIDGTEKLAVLVDWARVRVQDTTTLVLSTGAPTTTVRGRELLLLSRFCLDDQTGLIVVILALIP